MLLLFNLIVNYLGMRMKDGKGTQSANTKIYLRLSVRNIDSHVLFIRMMTMFACFGKHSTCLSHGYLICASDLVEICLPPCPDPYPPLPTSLSYIISSTRLSMSSYTAYHHRHYIYIYIYTFIRPTRSTHIYIYIYICI